MLFSRADETLSFRRGFPPPGPMGPMGMFPGPMGVPGPVSLQHLSVRIS